MYIAETWKETDFYLFPRIERRFITADDAEDGSKRYWCPWCHGAVTVEENSNHQCHFVHVSGEDCYMVKKQKQDEENSEHPESRRHKWMKAEILNIILDNNPNHTDNYGLEYWLGNRRPDAYAELFFEKDEGQGRAIYKVAIECLYRNWDDYSTKSLNDKTDYYAKNYNANTLWVIDFDDDETFQWMSKTPMGLGSVYDWFNKNYYNRIYGFCGKNLWAAHPRETDKEKKLYTLDWFELDKKTLALAKPKSVLERKYKKAKDIIAFSDYQFWTKEGYVSRIPYNI